MKFRLSGLLAVTTLAALALGAFGGMGIVVWLLTLYGWSLTRLERPPGMSRKRWQIDSILVTIAFLSIAAMIIALSAAPIIASGEPMPQGRFALVCVYFALAFIVALWSPRPNA